MAKNKYIRPTDWLIRSGEILPTDVIRLPNGIVGVRSAKYAIYETLANTHSVYKKHWEAYGAKHLSIHVARRSRHLIQASFGISGVSSRSLSDRISKIEPWTYSWNPDTSGNRYVYTEGLVGSSPLSGRYTVKPDRDYSGADGTHWVHPWYGMRDGDCAVSAGVSTFLGRPIGATRGFQLGSFSIPSPPLDQISGTVTFAVPIGDNSSYRWGESCNGPFGDHAVLAVDSSDWICVEGPTLCDRCEFYSWDDGVTWPVGYTLATYGTYADRIEPMIPTLPERDRPSAREQVASLRGFPLAALVGVWHGGSNPFEWHDITRTDADQLWRLNGIQGGADFDRMKARLGAWPSVFGVSHPEVTLPDVSLGGAVIGDSCVFVYNASTQELTITSGSTTGKITKTRAIVDELIKTLNGAGVTVTEGEVIHAGSPQAASRIDAVHFTDHGAVGDVLVGTLFGDGDGSVNSTTGALLTTRWFESNVAALEGGY